MSALTNRGSTAAWRRLRAWWAAQLPQPCPRCRQPVQPWDEWDLDHQVPRARGGTDDTARPAHAHCNRSAQPWRPPRVDPRAGDAAAPTTSRQW